MLPVRFSEDGKLFAGLIYRETPHQGLRWCTIGGRLLHGEPIAEAIKRQLIDALGDGLIVPELQNLQPVHIAQYAPSLISTSGFDGVDPRKHAVGLTYCVEINGEIKPRREAIRFAWFDSENLPEDDKFGFRQEVVVRTCLTQLKSSVRQVLMIDQ